MQFNFLSRNGLKKKKETCILYKGLNITGFGEMYSHLKAY